jgi:hypothetical protein
MPGYIAYIDLDGVVCNNDARFERATGPDGKVNWSEALNGEHVHLDTLIEGAPAAIGILEQQGYTIAFFSSRPEHMRDATITWLTEHGVSIIGRHLVLKPPAAQFVKTIVWKAATLDTLTMFLNAHSVIYVDDEDGNTSEVVKHLDRYNVRCYASLEEAIKA